MIKFAIDGRSVRPDEIGNELMKAAVATVAAELRERVEAIRHPETGEFPTVVIHGSSLDSLSINIEGSPALLSIVRDRLAPEDLEMIQFSESGAPPPRAFLSFAWEDKALAERIAQALQAKGIDVWFAKWSLAAGDSMRQKIDEGLAGCTHFLVLITPGSIDKPWVNQEMDAGLILKIESKAKFIALRRGVAAEALPPLLRGMISPALDDFDSAIPELIGDIHGISRKPARGPAPTAAALAKTEYSPAATAIAKVFVEQSQHGDFGDPQLSLEAIAEVTSLSADAIVDGLHELRGMIQQSSGWVRPLGELFATFDKHWKDWDPAQDALRIAADLVNGENFPGTEAEIAKLYGWEPRRMNASLAYLLSRNLIEDRKALGTQPWAMHWVVKNDNTRRFVKSRSA